MRHLGLGAVLLALFAFAPVAPAGDDTMRLDLKKSSKIALVGGTDAASPFTHDARAKLSDDDVEDIFFGYSRGYWRGSRGYGYVIPRFYRYRAGYWAGSYGGGWYPFRGFFGGYRWGYPWFRSNYYGYGFRPYYGYGGAVAYSAPTYDYGAPSYGYSDPGVTPVDPGAGYVPRDAAGAVPQSAAPTRIPMPARTGTGTAPRNNLLPMPRQGEPQPKTRIPMPSEPAPKNRPSRPMPPADKFDADGPTGPPPSYRYDGGPNRPVPMPPAGASPSGPAPKSGSGTGRIVKLSYPAYGDNLRNLDRSADGTVVVKKNDK